MSENPVPEQEKKAYEYIRVGTDELQSEKFLALEKELIAGYTSKGYSLTEKTPAADMHRNETTGQAIMTFVYIFEVLDEQK